MNTFTENESYKHKMAKEVLKGWFYGGKWIGDVGCSSPNRECGVWFEYPIVKTDNYNSIDYKGFLILGGQKRGQFLAVGFSNFFYSKILVKSRILLLINNCLILNYLFKIFNRI